jgi:hypothetical protein
LIYPRPSSANLIYSLTVSSQQWADPAKIKPVKAKPTAESEDMKLTHPTTQI